MRWYLTLDKRLQLNMEMDEMDNEMVAGLLCIMAVAFACLVLGGAI